MSRWVKNSSDHLPSDPELSVLMKGLNFAVTHRRVLVIHSITATASPCKSHGVGDVHELTVNVLERHDKVRDQNVSKSE